MEVLDSGYIVLFRHLPLVSWEPHEFLSYTSGSVKAQALQQEMNKMLQKGALELVDHLGLDYYSWLFLVQMASGGGIPWSICQVWTAASPSPNSRLRLSFWCWGSIRKWDLCSWSASTHSSGLSTLSPDHTCGQGLPVQGSMFWPFYSSSGLCQSIFSGLGVGLQEGNTTLVLSGQLISDRGVGSSPASTSRATPSALSGPGCGPQHGKSDHKPSSTAQYLRMLIDTVRNVFSTDSDC